MKKNRNNIYNIIEETTDNSELFKKRITIILILLVITLLIIYFDNILVKFICLFSLLLISVFYYIAFTLNNYYNVIGNFTFKDKGILINDKLLEYSKIKNIDFYYEGFQNQKFAGVFTDTIYGENTSKGINNYLLIEKDNNKELIRFFLENKLKYITIKKQLSDIPTKTNLIETPLPHYKVHEEFNNK